MRTRVGITREPLVARGVTSADAAGGAVVEFAGVVRVEEDGARISALDYEAYEVMARSEMERIVRELSALYPCHEVDVTHRIGPVPVGEASILVRIVAKHRAEAFGLLTEFMDRLKRDVPIWKKVIP
ncbi:MAG: molybdenum cofactor biosynthesis protein MoaE [Chthoniobacterales bacterium]|jgi:molybdopterin synthase catalytic subunit